MTTLDCARLAFLLTLAEADDTPLARYYLAEKSRAIFACRKVWQVRGLLDRTRQAIFDRHLGAQLAKHGLSHTNIL